MKMDPIQKNMSKSPNHKTGLLKLKMITKMPHPKKVTHMKMKVLKISTMTLRRTLTRKKLTKPSIFWKMFKSTQFSLSIKTIMEPSKCTLIMSLRKRPVTGKFNTCFMSRLLIQW